jgi:hypothetical protein
MLKTTGLKVHGEYFTKEKRPGATASGFFLSFPHPPPFCTFAQKRNAMATNITTPFQEIYLSSHLPEIVYISTSENSIEFTVYVDSVKVFSSVYYPYNQIIRVRDIQSIVEREMFEQDLFMITLTLEAKQTDETSSVIDDVKVICSSFKTTLGTVEFLKRNFLTTRKSALIPRDGRVYLYNFTKANEEGNNYIRINYVREETPDQVSGLKCYLPSIQSQTDAIEDITLTEDYCKGKVGSSINCIILSADYHIGARAFSVFFTDETPSYEFSFINAFNVQERVYLFGATTTKTEVSRSEAVCGKKSLFYDETVTVKHEVETAPMPYEEALWFSQMFTSKWVNLILPNNNAATVLISDITSEVSDSNKELIKLKFSWKYADGVEWI